MGAMGRSVRVRTPWRRQVPRSRSRLAAILGSLAALVPAATYAQAGPRAGGDRPCFAMAGLDPVDVVKAGRPDVAPDPGTGGPDPRRGDPITREEVPLLIRDLERVPLESGGFTIRAMREGGLPPERLRQLVGDVQAVLVVRHGREVLGLLRKTRGVRREDLRKLERNVEDVTRCVFERLGGEREYQRVIDLLGELRPQVEAAVLEPLAAERSPGEIR